MKPKIALLLLLAIGNNVADSATITWTNTSGGNWSFAANWSPNQAPGSSDNAVITASGTYAVTLDTSPTINSLTLGGVSGQQTLTTGNNNLTLNNASVVNTNGVLVLGGGSLSGGGLLTVNGKFNWTGGSIGSGSTLTVGTNGVLVLAGNNGSDYDIQGVLTNAGTVRLASGNLRLNSSCTAGQGELINLPGALVDITADVSIDGYCGNELLLNYGTVRKSGGTGTSTINPIFNNFGLLDVQSGTVSINGGDSGNSVGVFQTEAGATLKFVNNFTANGGVQFTGVGTNLITGGTFTLNGSVTVSNLVLAGASLTGTNGVIAGLLTWTSGSIASGSKLTIATNGVLVLAGNNGSDYDIQGVLTNAGTVRLASGNLRLNSSCTAGQGELINLPGALVDITADVSIDGYCGNELLLNYGTVRKSGGTGTSTINPIFNNFGLLDVQTGALYFTSPFVEAGGSFSVRINGATSWGRMLFASALTLGGQFNVSLSSGYVPTAGSEVQVLSFPSVSGGFTAYYGLDLGGGLKFVPRLDSRAFFLQVSTYSADATPTLSVYRIGDNLLIWWPTAFSNYVAMTTTNLAAPAWTPLSLTGPDQLLISPNQPQQYFRLMK